MKHTSLALAATVLFLAGCGAVPAEQTSLEQRLQNPLFAERYAEEMVDRMVEYSIRNDAVLEDKKKADLIEKARKQWLDAGRIARKKQQEGVRGFLVSIQEDAKGEVLYVDDTLYTDTVFTTVPGPDLHLYITTVVDPREVEFPDNSAVDVGRLSSPYGAQTFAVPPVDDPESYRTVVLWDDAIGRLYGFAQLSK